MMFNIGQEVVCVDDSVGAVSGTLPPFKLSDIVTVKESGTNPFGYTYVRLVEHPCKNKWGWRVERFAPLISNGELQEELNEVLKEEIEFV